MAISAAQGARSRWYATTLTMNELTVRLKRGRSGRCCSATRGSSRGAIADLGPQLTPGSLSCVCARRMGHFLARGYANPRCAIAVRILTWRTSPSMRRSFAPEAAVQWRRSVLPAETDAFRLINGEGDCSRGYSRRVRLDGRAAMSDRRRGGVEAFACEAFAHR